MAASRITFLLLLFAHHELLIRSNGQQKWIKSGYWYIDSNLFAKDINSALFSHLLCCFARIDPSTYKISIPSAKERSFSTFTDVVRIKNPSITTLLSISSGSKNSTILFNMARDRIHRRSFIESSIQTARLYHFGGVDLLWASSGSGGNATDMATFLAEWRAAAEAESRGTHSPQLLLTMAVRYLPVIGAVAYPINSIRENLDWVNIVAYDYYLPGRDNFTGAHAALYDPSSRVNTDYGVKEWVRKGGLPANKVLLGLPYHGYAWTVASPTIAAAAAGVRVRASGPAIMKDGSVGYSFVKWLLRNSHADSVYNSTYAENFYSFSSTWIVYDDVEAIKTKVNYAKDKGLLGYCVFQVSNDENWVLSQTAADGHVQDHQKKLHWLAVIAPTVLMGILLFFMFFYLQRAWCKPKELMDLSDEELFGEEKYPSNEGPHLRAFHFVDMEAATNNFSIETKLGEGGYGSVYKGKLKRGKEIAIKRLSKTSKQGLEEFRNEVTLTAKLQHVNLVKLLGFCDEKDEKMLVYEYMPNKSLDLFLYDPVQRSLLDWGKRMEIIEGIIQGLLYLQEYSRLTIIHRDLKASNILLDQHMKPKISDLGLARSFLKGEHEANTGRIVGTYGYAPPEYVKRGIYSAKSDVYSFGVLLLQIIGGKTNKCSYGPFENLSLLDHAYELWRDGKCMEFMDPCLDDSSSLCKLAKCMQVALLCVQERGEDRPSMIEVFSMLNNETAAIRSPHRPAFSTKEEDAALPESGHCSNLASITEMVPR